MEKNRKTVRTMELTLEIDRSTLREVVGGTAHKVPTVVFIGGLDVGKVVRLDVSDRCVLGRDDTCDCMVRDDGISRYHAEIIKSPEGRYILRDLDSTNGVFVGRQKVSTHVLVPGEKILLGRRTVLRFEMHDKMDLRYQEQIYSSSVRDALTGAFNRKHFDERMASELSFTVRHRVPLSLLMFDLDHFKNINDTYGHQAGDQVLKAVARVMTETLRDEDFLARYGGEEFVVVARGTDPVGALALGERLRATVENLQIRTPEGERIQVTISVGCCTILGGDEANSSQLIKMADENLYKAKNSGRNQVAASQLRPQQDFETETENTNGDRSNRR